MITVNVWLEMVVYFIMTANKVHCWINVFVCVWHYDIMTLIRKCFHCRIMWWRHRYVVASESVMTVSEPILVATAHLFWDPEYPDVKLIQTMLLTQELQRIAANTPPHLMTSRPPPLILVGDFNALPDSGLTWIIGNIHFKYIWIINVFHLYIGKWFKK